MSENSFWVRGVIVPRSTRSIWAVPVLVSKTPSSPSMISMADHVTSFELAAHYPFEKPFTVQSILLMGFAVAPGRFQEVFGEHLRKAALYETQINGNMVYVGDYHTLLNELVNISRLAKDMIRKSSEDGDRAACTELFGRLEDVIEMTVGKKPINDLAFAAGKSLTNFGLWLRGL